MYDMSLFFFDNNTFSFFSRYQHECDFMLSSFWKKVFYRKTSTISQSRKTLWNKTHNTQCFATYLRVSLPLTLGKLCISKQKKIKKFAEKQTLCRRLLCFFFQVSISLLFMNSSMQWVKTKLLLSQITAPSSSELAISFPDSFLLTASVKVILVDLQPIHWT